MSRIINDVEDFLEGDDGNDEIRKTVDYLFVAYIRMAELGFPPDLIRAMMVEFLRNMASPY